MKALITKRKNRENESFTKRILVTIGLVTVYLFGTYIVIPGIEPIYLTGLKQQTGSGLMALWDMFSGGAFSNASILAMGIMPYIIAFIVMRSMTIAIPFLRKMQYESESGRRRINRITHYLALVILIVQSFAYITNLQMQMTQVGALLPPGLWYMIFSITILTAGSMFVLWLCKCITDKGVGNGFLLIIVIGVINSLPHLLIEEFYSRMNEQAGGWVMFLIEILFLLLVIAGAIFLVKIFEYYIQKRLNYKQ